VEKLLADVSISDVEAVGRLRWIRALLFHELVRWDEAVDEYELAIRWAIDHGLRDVEARARGNLAVLLTQLGRTAEAAEHLTIAIRTAPPSARGLIIYLTGVSKHRRGDHREACAQYERALPLLEAVGDLTTIEVLRLNRGVSLIYLGDLDGAHRELAAAEHAATQLGLTILAGMAAHDLGFLESRRGHLADALEAYDRAERLYRRLRERPRQMSVLHSDRAEVLLQAGLATDARASALQAIDELQADGNMADLVEAQLHLARSCLATGDHDEARRVALAAARGFRTAQRPPWVAQACYVARQIDYQFGVPAEQSAVRLSQRFQRTAVALNRCGWPVEGRDALVFAALAALRAADIDRAATLLNQAARRRGAGAVPHRARLHLARALLMRATGRPDRAADVVRRGVTDALEVLTLTGSTEARLESLRFAGELAELGTSLALQDGWPVGVLRAVERQRSLASVVSPARLDPGRDAAPSPAEQAAAPVDQIATVRATPLRPGLETDAEHQIREWSLRRRAGESIVRQRLRWRDVRAASSDRNLVYFLEGGGHLRAVVVRGSSTRLVDLGLVGSVVREVQFHLFALQRAAIHQPAGRSRARAARPVPGLDQLLIEPLALAPGPLVIVPCPAVRDIRWSLLPSLTDRDVTLTASGLDWVEAQRRAPVPPEARVVLVSGPRLESRDREVKHIAQLYPDVSTLLGSDATRENVIEGFGQADIIHIAAHGLFREESPMFSRLELADGGLTIYDLERLRHLPSLVVLSACGAAASRLYPSGAALGTASALTALGARTVVAPVQPVVDAATCDVMTWLHERLAAGAAPSEALRLAVACAADNETRLTAGHFVTMGAG
jgi:tetratricopeptide (TPR) repeat protein